MTQYMPIEELLAIPCPWDREPSLWQAMREQLDRIAALVELCEQQKRHWLRATEWRAA